jgi:hypothetical protein
LEEQQQVRGSFVPQVSTIWSPSEDSDARVTNRKFRLPPSGLNPAATAIASINVDFPLPFFPTKRHPRPARPSQLAHRRQGERIPAQSIAGLQPHAAQEVRSAHRSHRALTQAAPLRALPEHNQTDTRHVHRHDRLGGLVREYQQVA